MSVARRALSHWESSPVRLSARAKPVAEFSSSCTQTTKLAGAIVGQGEAGGRVLIVLHPDHGQVRPAELAGGLIDAVARLDQLAPAVDDDRLPLAVACEAQGDGR